MSEQGSLRQKPVILVFIRHYLPGFRSGGPVRSVANLVKALESEYDFRIVCLNRDHGEKAVYPNVRSGQWTKLGAASVYYATEQEVGFRLSRRLANEIKPDMIYLNSLFDREFSMKPFLALGFGRRTPVLLAPRGELSNSALDLKAKRKRIFLAFSKASRYFSKANWHSSSTTECERIRMVISPREHQLFLASNLPQLSFENKQRKKLKQIGRLKIVLAARISPMKNTLAAIQIAAQLQSEVQLDLYGTLEDSDYWAACMHEIAKCPANVKVRYLGEIPHEQINEVLQEYDVMLMPTLGENFGHSIIEAMAAGLPVVISDRTPWRGLIEAGVGADLPLENVSAFVNQLVRFQQMHEEEIQHVGASCRKYVRDWQEAHMDLNHYRKIFDTVIASASKKITVEKDIS